MGSILFLLQVAAEKAAWEASKKEGFELITICPTFVLGPVISNRADATSILDVKVGVCPCLKQRKCTAVMSLGNACVLGHAFGNKQEPHTQDLYRKAKRLLQL